MTITLKTPVDLLIERAKRTPYFHLHHADGSLYMERHWLMPFDFGLQANWKASPPPPEEPQSFSATNYELREGVRHLPACRLHHICTPDLDREMHNHPWSFTSIILRGGYVERRPIHDAPRFIDKYEPIECDPFDWLEVDERTLHLRINPPVLEVREEESYDVKRGVGSVAFRSHNDRHRIVSVEPDTWTLVILGPKRQSWGFFTEGGFVPWREFESVHNVEAIS